jgi:hypothetical protein
MTYYHAYEKLVASVTSLRLEDRPPISHGKDCTVSGIALFLYKSRGLVQDQIILIKIDI